MPTSKPRPTESRSWWWVLLTVALIYGAYHSSRALLHPLQGIDFSCYWVAVQMVADENFEFYTRENHQQAAAQLGIEGPDPNRPGAIPRAVYPPWVLAVYYPFSRASYDIGRHAWFLFSLACLSIAFALMAAVLRPPEMSANHAKAIALCMGAAYFPIHYGLFAGQINAFVLMLYMLAVFCLRRGHPWIAGFILAPAAGVKIITGAGALYLVAERQWRALAALVGGIAALLLSGLLFVPYASWKAWFAVLSDHGQAPTDFVRNHSIGANFVRLFTENGSAEPLLALAPATVQGLSIAVQGVVFLLVATTVLRPTNHESLANRIQATLPLVLIVLCTPKGWIHYGTYALPLLFVLITSRPHPLATIVAAATFTIWAFTFQLRSEYEAIRQAPWSVLMTIKGASLIAVSLAAAVCAWRDRDARRDTAAESAKRG